MGRHSCCHKQKLKKGLWSPEEDEKLVRYITKYGHGCWSAVPKQAGAQNYAYNPDLCHAAALGSSSLIISSPCLKLSMSKSFIRAIFTNLDNILSILGTHPWAIPSSDTIDICWPLQRDLYVAAR
jgi:hypothetical protein